MRIIRPHGTSQADQEKRVVKTRPESSKTTEITDFVTGDPCPKLFLAQYVSTVDKILKKPKPNHKINQDDRDRRESLGQALWDLFPDGIKTDNNKKIWQAKLHPYKIGKPETSEFDFKGRWYPLFCGNKNTLDKTDIDKLAEDIDHHLRDKAINAEGTKTHPKGLISHRASSIEKNIPSPPPRPKLVVSDNWCEYFRPDKNLAANIQKAIKDANNPWHGVTIELKKHYKKLFGDVPIKSAEQDKITLFAQHEFHKDFWKRRLKHRNKNKPRYCPPKTNDELISALKVQKKNCELDVSDNWCEYFKPDKNLAANIQKAIEKEKIPWHGVTIELKKHYKKLFGDVPIESAKKDKATLFAQHELHKDFWKRRLKHRNKNKPKYCPPKTNDELFSALKAQKKNRELARITKEGRKEYYNNDTLCLTSDGLTQIKRDEALMRVSAEVIAYANLSLYGLYPKCPQDILGGKCGVAHAKKNSPNEEKWKILFPKFPSESQEFGTLLVEKWQSLRHTLYHFENASELIKEFESLSENIEEEHLKKFKEYTQSAQKEVTKKLIKTLETIKANHYYSHEQLEALLPEIQPNSISTLPLPKFNRLLKRAKNNNVSLPLPNPVNTDILSKNPALYCQFILLRLLYQNGFACWMNNKDVHEWKEKTLEHTTKAAKIINQNGSNGQEIVARAAQLWPDKKCLLNEFIPHLQHITQSEMQVQKGYEVDKNNAKKQSQYIDNFLCDIIALAFKAYLKEQGLEFLLSKDTRKEQGVSSPPIAIDSLSFSPQQPFLPQQHVFFVMLHLLPVNAAQRLIHQLRRWKLGYKDNDSDSKNRLKLVEQMLPPLRLYSDYHDQQYADPEHQIAHISGLDWLKKFIPSDTTRESIFPNDNKKRDKDHIAHIPLRSLREMQRFGQEMLINKYQYTISKQEASDYTKKRKKIPGKQARLQTLHQKLSGTKKRSSEEQEKQQEEYRATLQEVVAYKHLRHKVLLTDLVKMHELTMQLYARLADFAWQWERDKEYIENADENENFQHFTDREIINIRNNLCHFNSFRPKNTETHDITTHLNGLIADTVKMLRYDRKRQKSVIPAMKRIFDQYGVVVEYKWDKFPKTLSVTCKAKTITHLAGKTRVKPPICEALVSKNFIALVENLCDVKN